MIAYGTVLQGTITFFHSGKNFGFITTPDGESYFFHVDNFEKHAQPVLEGLVEFRVAPPLCVGKRPQAVAVHYSRQVAIDLLAGLTTATEGSL